MKSSDENKLKVLHITPWYPHPEKPFEAVWIKRHVESVASSVDQYVFHVRVSEGPRMRYHRNMFSGGEQITFMVPTKRWFVFELVWFGILFGLFIIRRVARDFDVIQFHISYPALTYWHWLRHFVKKPVLIIEHWSAYHFNFGVKDIRKLKRIKRIFSHQIPVACVSRSLLEDLRAFSGYLDFRSYVLPNVVDCEIFYHDETSGGNACKELFMVSQWKWPKNPRIILEAFAQWNHQHEGEYILKIGGYGDQMDAILDVVREHGMETQVRVLGTLSSREIADEMRRSRSFVHCSEYETFSVVCAEALCCGVPVVASKVGGIIEIINDSNGILVAVNSVEAWIESLNLLLTKNFDRQGIASQAGGRFSKKRVGDAYLRVLNEIAHGTQR